jgi:hypothetical protein
VNVALKARISGEIVLVSIRYPFGQVIYVRGGISLVSTIFQIVSSIFACKIFQVLVIFLGSVLGKYGFVSRIT